MALRAVHLLVAATALFLAVGCDQTPTGNATGSGSLELRLRTSSPSMSLQDGHVRVTAVFHDDRFGPFEVLASLIDGVFEARIEEIPTGRYEIYVEVLDTEDGLVLIGEQETVVYANQANATTVTLEPIPEGIENEAVSIHFDHRHGCIDSLIWKQGSGYNLLDVENNQAYGRWGFGAAIDVDTACYLVGWRQGSNTATIEYAGSDRYTAKIFHLYWSERLGVEITVEYQGVDGTGINVGNYWQPGGDHDAPDKDYIGVRRRTGDIEIWDLTYPDTTTLTAWGQAAVFAFYDIDHEEMFGFRFDPEANISVWQSSSIEGPIVHLAPGDRALCFAVKKETDFVIWSVDDLGEF